MDVFADSSALVKLYADESGSETVRALTDVSISALAQVEVPSALWRKQRMGELSAGHVQSLLGQFLFDCQFPAPVVPRFIIMEAGQRVLTRAAELVGVHGLRAYNAVQLATAILFRETVGNRVSFAVFDVELSEAAAREGFAIIC